MQEIVIERQSAGSLSVFRIKSPVVVQELKRRGFVQVDEEGDTVLLQATGKWGHRRTRKVVHDAMRKYSRDPLTQAAFALEQPRQKNNEFTHPFPGGFSSTHLNAIGSLARESIEKCLSARMRRAGISAEQRSDGTIKIKL